MNRTHGRQSGFTILELMVVVAIVAVLAAIALPSFSSASRKSKGDSEVAAYFGELAVREEQYAVEKGKYLPTGTSESATFPATATPGGTSLGTLPTAWQSLKVRTPESTARCGYVVMAGGKSDPGGTMATTSFGFTTPQKNWFYILAHCDLDGNTAADSYYFMSSDNAKIQKLNHGQ